MSVLERQVEEAIAGETTTAPVPNTSRPVGKYPGPHEYYEITDLDDIVL